MLICHQALLAETSSSRGSGDGQAVAQNSTAARCFSTDSIRTLLFRLLQHTCREYSTPPIRPNSDSTIQSLEELGVGLVTQILLFHGAEAPGDPIVAALEELGVERAVQVTQIHGAVAPTNRPWRHSFRGPY